MFDEKNLKELQKRYKDVDFNPKHHELTRFDYYTIR